MRLPKAWLAAAGLLTLLAPSPSSAQGVAFQPVVGALPDGVHMDVTPAVSADRRYVRLSLNVGFQSVQGFQTYSVPAAVGGGGLGGGGRGLGIGGVGGGAVGMNGPINPGPGAGGYGMSTPTSGRIAPPSNPIDLNQASSPFASSFAEFVDGPPPEADRARGTRPKAKKRSTRAPRPARIGAG